MTSITNQAESNNLWQTLLNSSTRTSDIKNSTIILLGNTSSGKATLVNTMQSRFQDRRGDLSFDLEEKHQSISKQQSQQPHTTTGNLLKYSFLPAVHPDDADADIDTAPTCDIWTLSNPNHGSFLKLALKQEALPRLAVVIVLDFSRPSSMIESLEKWLKIIIDEIKPKINQHSQRNEMLTQLKDHIRLYRVNQTNTNSGEEKRSGEETEGTEGSEGIHGKGVFEGEGNEEDGGGDRDGTNTNATMNHIDLAEGVLTQNHGVPIVVCCNKSDCINEQDIPIHVADHIQKKIREICLTYGAALMYVSSTNNMNTDTLHTYLLHRLYPSHFKFSTSAEVVDSSRIFVPSGWDSVALVNDIDINNDINLTKFGKLPIGETSIENTSPTKKTNASHVTAYTEQTFLERLMKKQEAEESIRGVSSSLQKQIGTSSSTEEIKLKSSSSSASKKNPGESKTSTSKSKESTSNDSGRRTTIRRSATTAPEKSSSGSDGGKKNAKDNPKLIKNFFQSLLNPKDKKATSKRRSSRNKKPTKE